MGGGQRSASKFAAHGLTAGTPLELHEIGRRRNVLDELGGVGADAEVAEVGEGGIRRAATSFVGDVEDGAHHCGDIATGVEGKVGEVADGGDILGPAGVAGVNGTEGFAHGLVTGDVGKALAGSVFVGDAKKEVAEPFAAVGEGVGLVDHEVLKPAVAEGVAFFHGVEPADHALAAGGGAELEALEERGERVSVIYLSDESVGADLGVVSFGDAESVNGLHGQAGALEELGREGVGGGDVGREAMTFVEPVGLAELADDGAAGGDLAADELTDLADVFGEARAGAPVNGGEFFEVQREGRVAAELFEIEFAGGEQVELDGGVVGAEFGGGEGVEKAMPIGGRDAADVFDGAYRAVGALGEAAGEEVGAGEEVAVGDLPLGGLVGVGRGDATAGGAAGFLGENVDAVVFPGEVEEAVGEVGDHGALVDEEPVDDAIALMFERGGFPPNLAGIGDDAAADGEVGDVALDEAAGQEVELNAGGGVAGVGAAVDLEHGGDGVGRSGELGGDLRDKAAFAFVAEGNADIGDEAAGKGEEGHGCGFENGNRRSFPCCSKAQRARGGRGQGRRRCRNAAARQVRRKSG